LSAPHLACRGAGCEDARTVFLAVFQWQTTATAGRTADWLDRLVDDRYLTDDRSWLRAVPA